jgi:predicted nuclease with TOPRIM domain
VRRGFKENNVSKKKPDLKTRNRELEKGIEEFHTQCGELRKRNESLMEECTELRNKIFRLDSLCALWKASALRYQSIAAALSQAYNNVYPIRDGHEYSVRASHDFERKAPTK